ncbi:MAG: hypothetical protein ACJ75F_07660 [Flavisolibacter sp.]
MISIRRIMNYYFTSLAVSFFLFPRAYAQVMTAEPVVKKFEEFNKTRLQEKIYLHTDKNFYVAGELVWFKAYYVDGWFHQPLQVSKILYVDLLDKQNNSVLRTMISLRPGEDNGSLQLPLSLKNGNYRLRGYTNWMKNLGPGFFFEKQLMIVNPLKAGDSVALVPKHSFSVDFFPEGGHLVRGLESRIGFAIKDNFGKGVNALGFIISAGGDTVARFHPLKFGLGNFSFTPNSADAYTGVVVISGGTVIKKDLPAIDEQGFVMKLVDEGTQQLIITITSNRNLGNYELLLLGHTRQVLKVAMKAVSHETKTEFIIDKSKLGDGISQFTIFTKEGLPICERLFFKRPASTIGLKISANNENYHSREKFEINIHTTLDNRDVPVQMSLAVYKSDSLQEENQMNIQNYLWMRSDLTGDFESPGYYFSDDSEVTEATDNLMLVHGWRKFKWESMLSDSQPSYAFPVEFNGHIVNGRITEKNSGRPVEDVLAFLSVPFSPSLLFSARSNDNGFVHFNVKNYYGAGEVVAQPVEKSESYRVEISSPYSDAHTDRPFIPLILSPRENNKLEEYSIGMQTEQIYNSDGLSQYHRPFYTDTLPFYGRPDAIYYLDQFTRFTTMEEVLREYVREVNVFTRNGKMKIKILNEEKKEFFEKNMLVMLDGIPLSDPDQILQFDPLKIRKLEVIAHAYIYGPFIFTGVVNLFSYKNNFEAVDLDPTLVRIDYEGIQMNRIFYAPVYETPEQKISRKPDFRNTLFWAPDISTDAKGETKLSFYTSDQKGKYTVMIQGMDQSGHTAVSSFDFIVN